MAFELIELKAAARERVGKGAARQARRDGQIPAVIYGDNKPPTPISLDRHELEQQVKKGHFTSTVVEVNLDGDKVKVIPRDVQVHPVRDTLVHVDLLRISADGIIRAAVPVHFLNESKSPGLKRGGVLNVVRHDIEVFCPYDRMPSSFDIDLQGLEIGATIHVSSLSFPDGVKPVISDRDFTVATIQGAVKQEAEETSADDEAEAEGATKEKAEGDGAKEAGGDDKK